MHFNTTLLVFIHGFKGSDNTFDAFPEHLQQLLTEALTSSDSASSPTERAQQIVTKIYPQYSTRGDLPSAVLNFKEWLVSEVLALEKGKEGGKGRNDRPIERPGVGVVLVGHSMGALVASDALFSFLDEAKEAASGQTEGTNEGEKGQSLDAKTMFPAIQGLLAFDTPFCGLSRAMFAYGAFAQYQQVSSAYGLVTSLSSLSLPSTSSATDAVEEEQKDNPAWKIWQAIAMRTGAAGAIAAAGAAAYMYREQIGQGLGHLNQQDISTGFSAINRENIQKMFSQVSADNIQQGLAYISRENLSHGLTWMSSHLQFVGALMRGQELQERIGRLSALEGVGFADMYTSLGQNSYWSGGYFIAERTFCALPPEKTEPSRFYLREVNSKAKDEIKAHTNMFSRAKNPGYDEMSERAKGLVLMWMRSYEAKMQDPYPERRREQMEAAVQAEKTQEKYPGLTKYSYGDKGGLQQGKGSGWMPTMPAVPAVVPTYQGVSQYMPTYGGVSQYVPTSGSVSQYVPTSGSVSQYMPSMSWRRQGNTEELGAEAKDASESAGETQAEGDNKARAEVSESNDAAPAPATAESNTDGMGESAVEDPSQEGDDDLMGTLKRTGSIPGVTEDLIFQKMNEASTTANEEVEKLQQDQARTALADEASASAGQSEHEASSQAPA